MKTCERMNVPASGVLGRWTDGREDMLERLEVVEESNTAEGVVMSEACVKANRRISNEPAVESHRTKPKLSSTKRIDCDEPGFHVGGPKSTQHLLLELVDAAQPCQTSSMSLSQRKEKVNRKVKVEKKSEDHANLLDEVKERRKKDRTLERTKSGEAWHTQAGSGGKQWSKRWSRRSNTGDPENSPNSDGSLQNEGECWSEGEVDVMGLHQRAVFNHVFKHSSASSSSSSFNCSSPESDEVFSEGEEATTRRRTLRKRRSWRTFLAMMHWSLSRQSSWVQLAGHPGNFRPSDPGEVLKKFSEVENTCLEMLMGDPLRHFVPQYYGLASRGNERYIRLEDLLSGRRRPVIMDCKMGVRTFLEAELAKANHKPSLRSDMYQKMVKVDPAAPSAEEQAQGAVTKSRYLKWRDDVSSTSSLGFRIEAIRSDTGGLLRDFKLTRTLAQVTDVILSFVSKEPHILEAYLSRLTALNDALKESEFFRSHEIIGGSLLFIHDCTKKANVWMIDFGKTLPTPPGVELRHDVPWREGNREDGYLIGLGNLTSVLETALKQACLTEPDLSEAPSECVTNTECKDSVTPEQISDGTT